MDLHCGLLSCTYFQGCTLPPSAYSFAQDVLPIKPLLYVPIMPQTKFSAKLA
jgi:hypothetical protein